MKYPYEIARELKDDMRCAKDRASIIRDFAEVINKYNLEIDSNTPDFIIAEYLYDCLVNANVMIAGRCIYYNPEGK
jgi:hypothetical protein